MRRSRFARRHRAARRFAQLEAAALVSVGYCVWCLSSAIGVVVRGEVAPAACAACGRAWDQGAAVLVAEAYGVRWAA